MRRSVCYSDPKFVYAGTIGNWKFIYVPSTDLQKGARLKFDLNSLGREFDWQLPEVTLKNKANILWMESPNGKKVEGKMVFPKGSILPQYEFILTQEVKQGEEILFHLGATEQKSAKTKGNQAQTYVKRRRLFTLYVDPKGKGEFKETEEFHIDVRGGPLAQIRVIAPSFVNKNERFDIVVRFEDQFGNLTALADEDTLVELSYEQLRENISWKLFVPETGFINLPNLYFNEVGIYRIQLKNLKNNQVFYSTPICCDDQHSYHIYWGTFHGESKRYDSLENIESSLRQQRDEYALQFYGTSNMDDTSNEHWKNISNLVAEFNEEDRFVTFLGQQWVGEEKEEGLRQIIHLKDHKALLKKKESKSSQLKKIYKGHTPKDLISIPAFTMASSTLFDFEQFNPEYEKVVEIYNAWGSSECTKAEGNLRPIMCSSKKGVKEKPEGSIRKALNNNHRFGFVAGGYDDRGPFSALFEAGQTQYSPGMTAILADGHMREEMVKALSRKSCYATTGPKMVLSFEIAREIMGSELDTKAKPGLAYNRHIVGTITGTDQLKEIQIIRNGKVFQTFRPKDQSDYSFQIDDTEPIEKIAFPAKGEEVPFVYYYMRVQQQDGHIAWSSPIWIDVMASSSTLGKKGKKKKE